MFLCKIMDMKSLVFGILLFFSTSSNLVNSFTSQEVKCLVCKATVQEIENEIAKVDPNKKTQINAFRLDAGGNTVSKTVPLVKSEMYLTEIFESICEKMEDYVKATFKKNGRLTLLKMITADGKMNPLSAEVDFVQDGDLNKSLNHFCLEILEDHEDAFLKSFQAEKLDDNIDIKICSEEAKYCNDAPVQEDYEFDKEEL